MLQRKKVTTIFLFLSFFLSLSRPTHTMHRLTKFFRPVTETLNHPNALKYYLEGVAASICADYITTLCHELGHAITTQAFFNNVAGIRINSGHSIKLKLSKFFIELGLKPLSGGKTIFHESNVAIKTKEDLYKLLLCTAAGPIAGLATGYLFFEGLKKTYLKNNPFALLFQLVLCGNQIANLLPIYGRGSDGETIFKIMATLCAGFKTKKLYTD